MAAQTEPRPSTGAPATTTFAGSGPLSSDASTLNQRSVPMQVVDIDDRAAGWPPQRVRQRLVLTVRNQDGWAAGGQRQRQPATMSFVS